MRSFRLSRKTIVLFVFCAGFLLSVATVIIRSEAESVPASVLVPEAIPFVVSALTSNSAFGSEGYPDGIVNTLVSGGTKTIYITGDVQDDNGQQDIAAVGIVFYRSGVDGGSDCVENNANDCYVMDHCDLTTSGIPTETQQRYSCPVPLQYYADGTMAGGEFPDENWIAAVTVADSTGGSFTDRSFVREMQTLLAVDLPSSVQYGTLSLGASTDESSEAEMFAGQLGNDEADIEVSYSTDPGSPTYGGTMDCVHTGGSGSIPSGNQQWSLVPNHYGGSGSYGLTDVPAVAATNIGYRHGENPTKPLYWNIRIPSSGVSGLCTGVITMSAVSH